MSTNTLTATVTASELQCPRALLRSPAYAPDGMGECPNGIVGGYPLAGPDHTYVAPYLSVRGPFTNTGGTTYQRRFTYHGGYIFCCTKGRIYRSSDGTAWRFYSVLPGADGVAGSGIVSLGGYMYALAGNYVYVSTVTGGAWTPAYNAGELLSAMGTFGDYVYIGSVNSKLWRYNTHTPTSWTLISADLDSGKLISSISKLATNQLVVGTYGVGVCGKIFYTEEGSIFADEYTFPDELSGVMDTVVVDTLIYCCTIRGDISTAATVMKRNGDGTWEVIYVDPITASYESICSDQDYLMVSSAGPGALTALDTAGTLLGESYSVDEYPVYSYWITARGYGLLFTNTRNWRFDIRPNQG